MITKVFENKLKEYNATNEMELQNVLQEIIQQLVLNILSQSDFFSKAAFHGGTFLRLFHNMDRFSEDLDFVLKQPDKCFSWEDYFNFLKLKGREEGFDFALIGKSDNDNAVKKTFLKTDSIGTFLNVEFPFAINQKRKIKIKLEIDSNPPLGSSYDTHYLSFPTIAAITTQKMESSFASKSHALLCRQYVKGRDWYDFVWYVTKKQNIDFPLLKNALFQCGPWKGQDINVNRDWYLNALKNRIEDIDWKNARTDVSRFLPAYRQKELDLWSVEFFLKQLSYLADSLP
ncbi:MAG: nucleotidyl transferase AbiEii/AbiGii toxin family protein [Fibrobacteria bacterium]|nr:nucleotidyl transferase AbiEii/AbiGii toxin family protein [Fibrobacteria bacterium]